MPTPHAILLACATLSTLGLVAPAGRRDTAAAVDAQLRPGAVKELAAGKMLVAARGLPDPNFSETVILLVEHSADGSMGLVINRRSDVPLTRVFPNLKPAQGASSALYVGGPVSPDGVLALLQSKMPPPDSRRVLDDIHVVATREGLDALLLGLGSGAARARDTAWLVARLSRRRRARRGSGSRHRVATSDPSDGRADGAILPVILRRDRFAPRATRAETRPGWPPRPSAPPPSPALRRRGPLDQRAAS